jgi:hypothetical protein
MVRNGRHAVLLIVAALAIPACGDGGGGGGGGNNSGGGSRSQPLFEETFDGAFPGTSWSAPFSVGSGTSIQIASTGGDPALEMTTTSDPSFVGTTTTDEFSSRPMTVSVRMAATGSGEGSGGIAILDHLGAAVAAAEWHAATPSALTFRIENETNPSPVAVPLAGSGFHTFTFTVTASGEASWSLDGTVVMTRGGFPNDLVRVQLYDNISTALATDFAVFMFDDLQITSP